MTTLKQLTSTFVIVLFFLPQFLLAQKKYSFELGIQYGILKTFNRSELISINLPNNFELVEEKNLASNSFGLEAIFHYNKIHALKANFGLFENGSNISGIFYFDDLTSSTFQRSKTNYLYYALGFSHILTFKLPFETSLNIENGIMLLRRRSILNANVFQIKKDNIQYVLKIGISKKIWNRINISTRLTLHQGVGNFSTDFVKDGFKPTSIGAEVACGYLF